jgi:RHS repeat-associated protein
MGAANTKTKSFLFFCASLICFILFLPCIGLAAAQKPVAPAKPGGGAAPQTLTTGGGPIDVPSLSQTSAPLGVQVSSQGNTGAASAAIQIEVPPGRKGVAPNLTITYNSYTANGWIGVGWTLGLGEIQRSTKRGVDYNASDYVFSLGGSASELLPRGAGYFGEKLERTFSRYYLTATNPNDPNATSGWVVTTKDGTKYFYGTTAASRQQNLWGTFKWCLDRVEDTNGNYMTISYEKHLINGVDSGEIYISRIDYTGNTGLNPSNYVTFFYETRNDAPPMYTTNARVVTAKRLQSVEVYGNGQFVRRYVLSYAYSVSSKRSLLTSVTLYGSDGVAFPRETLFGYEQSATGFSTEETTSVSLDWGRDHGKQWADFNGDGKADFCRVVGNGGEVRCALSTGSGFGPTEISGYLDTGDDNIGRQWADFDGDGRADFCRWNGGRGQCNLSTGTGLDAVTYSTDQYWGFGDSIVRWADFNGDGRADLCLTKNTVYPNLQTQALSTVSLGNAFNSVPYLSQVFDNLSGADGQWADFNGDGRADYCQAVSCIVSTGTGFGQTYSAPVQLEGSITYHWVDFNGDGKADFCRTLDTSVECTLSTGFGFGETIYSGAIDAGQIPGRTFVDINGDGKADYCRVIGSANNVSSKITCLLSRGDSFGPEEVESAVIDWGNDIGRQWADFNGDGKADYCRLVETPPGSNKVRCTTTLSPSNAPPNAPVSAAIDDLLIGIVNSLGGTTTVKYTPSSPSPSSPASDNCVDINGKNVCLPFVLQTVSAITVDGGVDDASTTYYTYLKGFYDAAEREFRGFSQVESWPGNPQGQPIGAVSASWFFQDAIFKGLPYMQVVTDSADNIFTWTETSYGSREPYTGVRFPFLTQRDDYVCDGSVAFAVGPGSCKHARTRLTDQDYDTYGNVTHKRYDGDLAVNGDERDEYTEYNYDTTKWIVSLPQRTYIKDSAGTTKAETWFDYDTNGNPSRKTLGLVLGNKNHPSNPQINYSSYQYGNLRIITDAGGNPTITDYDSTFTYPARVTNALGHYVSKTYDYKFGKPLTETDVNGNTTIYTYDRFGRIWTVTTPDIGATPAYTWKEARYDGLGRTIMGRTAGSNGPVVSETIYNALGQEWRTSLPYFEGSRPACLTDANQVAGCVTYYYDPIGRVTDVQGPDSTWKRNRYMQGRTTLVDANNHQKVEEKDVYGRLFKVEEYTGTWPSAAVRYAITTYQYNVLGNLTDVYDAFNYDPASGQWTGLGNHTEIHYDPLSRKDSMNDPDMGSWTYSYDASGNLISQIDAKNQVIYFQYDAINRIRQKDYGTQKMLGNGDVVYTYDEIWSTNSKGRLTTVTDASGAEKYYYDTTGRTTTLIKTVDGVNYQTDTTYDELGRMTSLRYPDNETVSYHYDAGGHLSSIPGYVAYSNFTALGQPQNIAYNNGVTTVQQYYATHKRLYSITTNGPQGGLQNLSYEYDNAGNVSTISDLIEPNRTQTFTYDDINRLRFAGSSVYGTLEFRYNEIGNMTYNSRVSTSNYIYWKDVFGTKPHAVYQAGSNTYQYDANGNVSARNGVTIIYDYDNRPTNIGSTTFTYDFSGQRVKKNGTVYVGKLYECNGSSCVKYVFAGSNRIVSKSSSNTFYYHTDHLGSSSIITNSAGNKVQETYYYPFGETRYNSGSATHYKFTGQEEDPETGLYYYGARYYDPVIARFISPDVFVQSPFNPQMLNRYSYTINNPLRYTDPSGHFILGRFLKSFLTGFVAGVTFVLTGNPVLAGMVAGAVGGALTGDLRNVVIGAVTGGLLGGIASINPYIAYGMLAGGAIYSVAKDGLNGLAYFAGGILGGIAGAVTGYDLRTPNSNTDIAQVTEDDPLLFDGKKLTATNASGQEVGSWDASSGRLGSTAADQAKAGYGPIPEGNYAVRPEHIQRWTDLPWYQKALAVIGRGEWPGGPAVWGYERVPIEGGFLTRGGFFIHGGSGAATAGCIKVLKNISNFFNYLRAQTGEIPLTVNYTW